jgi:hypothetical protein
LNKLKINIIWTHSTKTWFILRQKYDNYIGGKFVAPVKSLFWCFFHPVEGFYPGTAHSTKEDLELAVDHAHESISNMGKTSSTERNNLLKLCSSYRRQLTVHSDCRNHR